MGNDRGQAMTRPSDGVSEWKDKPEGDGQYWLQAACDGDNMVVLVKFDARGKRDVFFGAALVTRFHDTDRWLRIPDPPPPPKPLPRSRQVELTAKLYRNGEIWWCRVQDADRLVEATFGYRSKYETVDACRKRHGIEPTEIE